MSVANPVVLSWNGPERRIYLKQGVDAFHWIDDIYIEYRQERRLNEDFRKYNAFVIASGNEPKGGGKATPRLLKLLENVKVIAWDENIEISVTGEAITDNADIDPTLFDNSTRTQPLIINYQPPAAEVIVVSAVADRLDYGGILHYDANNVDGVGQVHPIGTTANPVNNIEDGIAIGIKYALAEVHTQSDIDLDRDISGWSIYASFITLKFNSNGYKADNCRFENIDVNGDLNDSIVHIIRSNITEALNITGQINNSFHIGTIKIAADGNLNMTDCESGIPGLESPEIDMNAGSNTTLSSRMFSGGQTISNCDTPLCIATLSYADGGKPHIEPSCTDGLLSIRGIGFLDDRSNGTTIELSAWNASTMTEQDKLDIVNKVWDENLANHLTSGSAGEQLDSQEAITQEDKEDIANEVWNKVLPE